jgi:hypothetical protein
MLFRRRLPLFFDPPSPEALNRIPKQDRAAALEYLTGKRTLSPYFQSGLRNWIDVPRGERGSLPATLNDFQANLGVESLISWQDAIRWLRTAVKLWDLVRARDLSGLCQILRPRPLKNWGSVKGRLRWGWFIKEPDDQATAQRRPPAPLLIDDVNHWSAEYRQLSPEDVKAFLDHAQPYPPDWGEFICGATGETPDEPFTVAVREIQRRVGYALYREVHPSLDINPATGQLVMRMHPEDLFTALWFQFAQAVAGNKDYRQCRGCPNWFEMSPDEDARTARRLFCSDQCKSRDYRKRKDRAVELRGEGLKPAMIAERLKAEGLETDIDTVKNWVGRRKRS